MWTLGAGGLVLPIHHSAGRGAVQSRSAAPVGSSSTTAGCRGQQQQQQQQCCTWAGRGSAATTAAAAAVTSFPFSEWHSNRGSHSWMLTTCALGLHQRQAPRVQGGSSSRGTALTLCTGQRLQLQQGCAPPLKGRCCQGTHASAQQQQQQQQQQQWRPPSTVAQHRQPQGQQGQGSSNRQQQRLTATAAAAGCSSSSSCFIVSCVDAGGWWTGAAHTPLSWTGALRCGEPQQHLNSSRSCPSATAAASSAAEAASS